jgi:hypothetical protein
LNTCWDSAGGPISCAGTGQDGDLQAGTTANFSAPAGTTTYPTQYVTKDNLTGLIWKTCRQGFTGATCGGGGSTLGDYSTVSTICGTLNPINSGAGFAEVNTWRVPTVTELENLINHSVSGPASYSAAFPGELNTPILWTSTPDPNDSTKGFVISLGNTGNTTNNLKTANRGVRCVSGTSPTPAFTDRNDGTILDMNTGLIWKKCPQGLSGSTCSLGSANNVDWIIALNSCNTLNLGGLTWRLPNINELKTITDRSVSNPSIDSIIFPNTNGNTYWTSTTTNFTGNTPSAYWISFFIGDNYWGTKISNANVRCVSSLTPIQ